MEPHVVGWTKCFLTGREQYVRIGNDVSKEVEVTSGVPQGSVLGPTLFLLYINDQPEILSLVTKMFADDVKGYGEVTSRRDEDRIQSNIDNLLLWSDTWLMGYNRDKCVHMRVGAEKEGPPYHFKDPSLPGGTFEIKSVEAEKDLGVVFDKNLTFSTHIDASIKKANQALGTIKRTFSEINAKIFLPLYKSMVRPHLEYCQEVWSPWRKEKIRDIEKVQRRATKMVRGLKDLTYVERLRRLNLPSLAHRRVRGDHIVICKIVHGLLRTQMEIPFSRRNTRGHPLRLEPDRFRTRARTHFFTNRIVRSWNSLPEQVVMAPSLDSFKSRLDKYWGRTRDIYFVE